MMHRLLLLSIITLMLPGCRNGASLSGIPQIRVLSNRADLLSGGDALIEIQWPADADSVSRRATLNGESISNAFADQGGGRSLGLVTSLREGPNELAASTAEATARLTLTNYPIGGPIFSGPQVQPWACNTTDEPSLGPPIDAQCNAPTRFRYVYRTTDGEFADFDPSAEMPEDLATTTTDASLTVPYIVRIERGTMNRGIHEIAVLTDPSETWAPGTSPAAWNRKLVVYYGFGTSQQYRQAVPHSVLNHEALSAGFMVVSSSMLNNGQHANFVTAAETTMMLKEHIIEQYGPIRYTIGQGASGGALLQHLIADSYPGLLDGLLPVADWEDSVSGAYREFADSGLLTHAFETSPFTFTDEERGAISGWGTENTGIIRIEGRRILDYNQPDDGTRCAGEDSYDVVENPTGVRCTFQDFMASVLGRRAEDGYANLVYDNVGVQYGLVALESGELTPEKFVDLNARIGGYDVNGVRQPQRSAIDSAVAALLHRTGQVTFGRYLGNVPELVIRSTNNNDYHYPFRTYVNRNRLIAQNGHADNHVFWMAPPETLRALDAMDRWLAAIEADRSPDPPTLKTIRNRPADLVSACWIDGARVTDAARCDAAYPYFREPRTAAGDAPTIYTMKCRLKALRRKDYAVTFTDTQWADLQRTFSTGVCDYTQPPEGFQPNIPWLNYAGGPGGQPLGEAPEAIALE